MSSPCHDSGPMLTCVCQTQQSQYDAEKRIAYAFTWCRRFWQFLFAPNERCHILEDVNGQLEMGCVWIPNWQNIIDDWWCLGYWSWWCKFGQDSQMNSKHPFWIAYCSRGISTTAYRFFCCNPTCDILTASVITAASNVPLSPAPHPLPPALLQPHGILSSSSFASTVSTIAAFNVVSTFNLLPYSILAPSVVAYQTGPVSPEIGGNPSTRESLLQNWLEMLFMDLFVMKCLLSRHLLCASWCRKLRGTHLI